MDFNLKLYLVTDRLSLSMEEFLNKVEEAIKGGVTIVQLREKEISTRDYIELGKKILRVTSKYNIPLIIDDRLDVCLAIGAQGVHLGSEDMEIKDARRILGRDYIIGATAKSVAAAKKCQEDGADYIGCGAIYPTTTKVKTILTSVETLKEISNSLTIPVAAIGGLNKDNMGILKDTGIKGACFVSAIMKDDNPQRAARELVQCLDGIL